MDKLIEKDKLRAQKAAEKEQKAQRRALRAQVRERDQTYRQLTETDPSSSDTGTSSSWSSRALTPTQPVAPSVSSPPGAGLSSAVAIAAEEMRLPRQERPSILRAPSLEPVPSTWRSAQPAQQLSRNITEVQASDQEPQTLPPPSFDPEQPAEHEEGPSELWASHPDHGEAPSQGMTSSPSTKHKHQYVSMPRGSRRRKPEPYPVTNLLRKVYSLIPGILSATFQSFWAWRWILAITMILLLSLLWVVGIAMGTIDLLRDFSKRALCGSYVGRPILNVLGTNHICLDPSKLPEDPFATRRVATYITVYMPQLKAIPNDLSERQFQMLEVVSIIQFNEKLMFPRHGYNMVHVANNANEFLKQSWEQAVHLQSLSNMEMELFILKMTQTVTETRKAVAEVDQRGQVVTFLVEIFSHVFYFLTSFTKHFKIMDTFLFHVENTLPKLVHITKAAQTLQTYLQNARTNINTLHFYLKEEHKNFETTCNSYFRFRRPYECRTWSGNYKVSFQILSHLHKTISETESVLQNSTQELIIARNHLENTQLLLRSARSTLHIRWDVKILLSEVENILEAGERFSKIVVNDEKYTIIPDS